MTIIDAHHTFRAANQATISAHGPTRILAFIKAALERRNVRRQQKIDRDAFMALVGKEDWVYRDMGVHKGDVEWAAHLPLHVNAARELEKLRARTTFGR